MDIRALRYFVELVREQSFTRASEKLFVTQPTISKMIRNMEEELGQPLLSRAGRRFTLTDSGRVLFNRAQTILAEMQQLEAELADLQSLQFGRLALGIPPMVGHVYADLIRAYRSRYPKVELSIVEYGGRRIEQAVLEGELDLAITMLPTREEGALSVLDLDQYPIQVVLPDLPRWRD
ncbi:LysR family transcriptional regulator, partial [Aeromonas dhakensis]